MFNNCILICLRTELICESVKVGGKFELRRANASTTALINDGRSFAMVHKVPVHAIRLTEEMCEAAWNLIRMSKMFLKNKSKYY